MADDNLYPQEEFEKDLVHYDVIIAYQEKMELELGRPVSYEEAEAKAYTLDRNASTPLQIRARKVHGPEVLAKRRAIMKGGLARHEEPSPRREFGPNRKKWAASWQSNWPVYLFFAVLIWIFLSQMPSCGNRSSNCEYTQDGCWPAVE